MSGVCKLRSRRFTYHATDDPESCKDLPVGIQLVGPTLQEEVVLGIGEIVDAALKAMKQA